MAKKAGLGLERHQQLGLEIEAARLMLLDAWVELGRACGKTTKQFKLADKAIKALDQLKCEMDNVACRQFPDGSGVQATALYYSKGANAAEAIRRLRQS